MAWRSTRRFRTNVVVTGPLRQAPLHHTGQPRDAALDEPGRIGGRRDAVVVVRRVAHERREAALAGLGFCVGLDGGQALDRRELVVLLPEQAPIFNTVAARSDVGTERPKARPDSTAAALCRRALMDRRTSASLFRHVSHEMVMTFLRHEPSTSPHVVRRHTGFGYRSRLRRRGSVTARNAGAAGRFLPVVPRAPTGIAPAATAATTLPSRTSGATKLMTTDCVLGSVYGRLQPGSRPQRFSQGNVVFVAVSKSPGAERRDAAARPVDRRTHSDASDLLRQAPQQHHVEASTVFDERFVCQRVAQPVGCQLAGGAVPRAARLLRNKLCHCCTSAVQRPQWSKSYFAAMVRAHFRSSTSSRARMLTLAVCKTLARNAPGALDGRRRARAREFHHHNTRGR